MKKDGSRKLGWRKDWPALVYLFCILSGFITVVYDFWKLQHLNFQINVFFVIGIFLIIIGGTFRITSRMTLTKAGFTVVNSYKLQIVDSQRLITDGIYRRIRHPLYLGEMCRNLGFALLFSSLYGFVVMFIGCVFLLIRIGVEERMLLDQFGHEYEEYRKRTKKLIPYLY